MSVPLIGQSLGFQTIGVGGISSVKYDESVGAANLPFPFYNTFILIERATTPLTIVMPQQSSMGNLGSHIWWVEWDGLQDLTFSPNDSKTFINGVSSDLVFAANGGFRTLVFIYNRQDGYLIRKILLSEEDVPKISALNTDVQIDASTLPITVGIGIDDMWENVSPDNALAFTRGSSIPVLNQHSNGALGIFIGQGVLSNAVDIGTGAVCIGRNACIEAGASGVVPNNVISIGLNANPFPNAAEVVIGANAFVGSTRTGIVNAGVGIGTNVCNGATVGGSVVAIGSNVALNKSMGNSSIAIGTQQSAGGVGEIAIGVGSAFVTAASQDNAIRIGRNCVEADIPGRLCFGENMTALDVSATDGAISVPNNCEGFIGIMWNGTVYNIPAYAP